MKKFFNKFRQLQWKLTLTYTLVTVSAILLFEILGMFAIIAIIITKVDSVAPEYLQNLSEEVSPLVRQGASWQEFDDFLHPFKKPNSGEDIILSDFFDFTITFTSNSNQEQTKESASNTLNAENNGLFIIVNKDFKPLYNPFTSKPLDESLSSISQQHKAMFVQCLKEGKLLRKRNFNSVTMAQPIIEDGKVVGAILAGFAIPFSDIVSDVIPNLLKTLLVFTVIIAIIGSIFGFFSSRWLVHRFNKIQAGPEAWQKGKFDFRIDGSSKDELGKLARQLNNMAEEIQRLMQNRQELATLEERQRLARELHDSVKQQIFASGMQIAAVKLKTQESSTAKHLDAAEALIHQAQEELSGLIHKLMPVALEGKGLVQAIREHIEVWQENEGVLVDFQADKDIKIDSELEYALFRITQEACSNIARHSKASNVLIRLEQNQDNLTLRIEDNGIGFDKSKDTRGIGLVSMSERLEPFSGKLEIETTINKGTRIMVTVASKGAKDAKNHSADS